MPQFPAPPLGEVMFMPPLYHCAIQSEHPNGPCSRCLPIRSPEKTARMRTLTLLQHTILDYIRQRPRRPIDGFLTNYVFLVAPKAGHVDLVRAAVTAGQLQQRGLLAYERDSLTGALTWQVTAEGLTYLDERRPA